MENKLQNNEIFLKFNCIFQSILRKWKFILAVMIVCGALYDVCKTMTYKPQFQTSLQAVLYNENNTYSDLDETLSYIKSLDYIFNGQVVHQYVQEKMDVENIAYHVSINSVSQTNIVKLSVTSNKRSNAYYVLRYVVEWYQNQTDEYNFPYQLKVNEMNALNLNPIVENSNQKNYMKGFLVSGLLVFCILCFIEFISDTIRLPKDITNLVDCRLFAKIPKENKPRGKKFWIKSKKAILITSLKTSFFYKESIKKLRNRIEESSKKHGYKTILVTSSIENEGKSSIVANLAIALAQNGHKILLIDGDIRKPSIRKIFSITETKTLNTYLNGKDTWMNQIVKVPNLPNLQLLCASVDLVQSEELLSSDAMRTLIEESKYIYDLILIDSSPSRFLNDTMYVNEMVDASLLVVKQNAVNAKIVNTTISKLVNVKNNLIGCIYNSSVTDIIKKQRAYGYQYGYRYSRSRKGNDQ